MKFARLLWANLLRKKVRATLTILSFAVSLFLFGILAVVKGAFSQGIDVAGADRLILINKTSLIQPLPIAYQNRILRIPGVAKVTHATWFAGVYQDPKTFIPQFAIDSDSYRGVYPEFKIDPSQWDAFLRDREGCVVGEGTAKRFGWKLGDRIPFQGTIFRGTWEFNIRAIYHGTRQQDDVTQFWFHQKYLEERRQWGKGMVGWYTIQVTDPDLSPKVVKAIDSTFANSPWETNTQTEKSFATSFVKQFGNIEFLIMVIGSVVFGTLLLVTGNTMAISVRERYGELAVMKTIGYPDWGVMLLILGESTLFAAIGGGLGILLAKGFTLGGDPTGGLLPFFFLPPKMMGLGLVLAIVVGLLSGLLPALGARRLQVVEALRRI